MKYLAVTGNRLFAEKLEIFTFSKVEVSGKFGLCYCKKGVGDDWSGLMVSSM